MRTRISSLLLVIAALSPFTAFASSFAEVKAQGRATVTPCTYLKGAQICQLGSYRHRCVATPARYTLLTSTVYRLNGVICVEKTWTEVGPGSIAVGAQNECGTADDDAFQARASALLCQPWDGSPESAMRLGN